MNRIVENAANFIWQNARLLEQTIFEYFFLDGSPDRIRSVLASYQNGDGGFGHALEPDLRAPDSQPLFVEFGLRTLYECNIRDQEIAGKACNFIAQLADLSQGIPSILPSSQQFPRAGHWRHPASLQPSMDRLVGLVGLLNWQGISHSWLADAVSACINYITRSIFNDAHTILTSFCLVESVSQSRPVDLLFDKLAGELLRADFFCSDAPVRTYGLTPLVFAPSPTSFCRKIFTNDQIDAHLDDLLSQQQPDGGWPILWEPPGEMARCEWRAQKTVSALITLRAYGRI